MYAQALVQARMDSRLKDSVAAIYEALGIDLSTAIRMFFLDSAHLGELTIESNDHLRNHGFLLTPKGWRLAPMFDVNPNPEGGESALDRGDLIGDAEYYRMTIAEANRRYAEIKKTIG